MGLAQEASRVAAEFEYSAQDVNNGVKAFIRQMGENIPDSPGGSMLTHASRRGT